MKDIAAPEKNESAASAVTPPVVTEIVLPEVSTGAVSGAVEGERREAGEFSGWVVGVGASAGGLEALTLFVSSLPKDFDGAIVIAQHLAPHAKSLLVDLLARHSPLQIVSAVDRQLIENGLIYIAPPNHDIEIAGNRIHLMIAGNETRPKPSVDSFFESLAREYGPRSVGIILSGTGSDGSAGIRAIKSAGGITLAQDDRSAKYDGMPKSAVETGSVDSILPPGAIASSLMQILADHQARLQSQSLDSKGLSVILELIKARTGSDFRQYKSSTIHRRIAKRMSELSMPSLDAYRDLLVSKPGEVHELSKELLISVTSFFRDPEVFEELAAKMGTVISAKSAGQEVRVWVAGCATGEEAYSVAMILIDLVDRLRKSVVVKVFATDLDHDAVLDARNGIYPDRDIETIPHYFRSRFIERRENSRFEITKRVRDAVVFAKQDLIQNPPFVKLDLVTCRNVMIYFEPALQARLLDTFHYALLPSGLLLLGKSEAASAAYGLFDTVDRKTKLYQKLNVPSKMVSPTRAMPLAPADLEPRSSRRAEVGPTLAEMAYLRLLRSYEIGGVVIDEDGNVLQIIGDVSTYLGFHSPQADLRLSNLLPKGVGIEIPILIRKAMKDGEAHRSRSHKLGKGAKGATYVLIVRPLVEHEDGSPSKPLFLVNFEARKAKEALSPNSTLTNSVADEFPTRLAELEHELFVTREHLQTVIEELGVSNEELQSLNEELSSTNEELQASNEELETTNEELQSSNEELTTVNEELGIKTVELRTANTSLENVQNSIGSPMVVLDDRMRVRRYNNEALKIFSISPGDIGREVTRLSSSFEIPDFEARVRATLETGKANETICENAGSVYQMRAFPSFDEYGKIIGTILVFIDNTDVLRTKERLTTSEQRIRAIIDSSPGLICLKDALGRYLIVNQAYREYFGFEDGEMLGKTDRELFPERLASQLRDGDLEIFLKRHSSRKDEHLEQPTSEGGQKREFSVSRFPLADNSGAAPYAVGTIAFDVTRESEAREALRQSELRYRAIAEDQAVFVCRLGADFTLSYVNNVFSGYFGGTQETNIGRNFADLILESERANVLREIKAISFERPVVQYEHRVERFGVSDRWVRWIHRGMFDTKGQIREYQAIGFDVTEYRQSTDELIRKEAVFTGIFNNTTDFITVYRVNEQNEFVLESLNRSAERTLGLAYAQLIGRRMNEFLNPDRADDILSRYKRVLASKTPDLFDEDMQMPGGLKNFATTIVPIPGPDGKVERVAALSRDVSSYKTIERDLRKAKDAAEIANRAKSDFLASMSHELRTPLNVVLGLSQLLEDTALDPEQQGYVKSIHRSGRVLLALIEDVLDISKIEAGKVRLENVPFSLPDLMFEIVDLFAAQAAEKKIQLVTDISKQADCAVVGDPSRLRQVLVNFVSNALKFTDSGSITLKASADLKFGALSPTFQFEVLDSGIGIKPEDHDKIFQKFSQVQSGNSRRYGGTGLGLVISRHLIELMGGEIGFESEAGHGSRFWFRVSLPITNVSAKGLLSRSLNDAALGARPKQVQLSQGEAPRAKSSTIPKVEVKDGETPLRVLAVDDNRDSQAVIALLLKRMGYNAIVASSGPEAISQLINNDVSVVLMDVQMPGMDGYEATSRIRALATDKAKIPIIALTANALAGDAEKCIASGMDAYLTKPVRIEALKDAITKWSQMNREEP